MQSLSEGALYPSATTEDGNGALDEVYTIFDLLTPYGLTKLP